MRVLIIYGTKHGSTKRIAEEISAVLKGEGFQVRMADAREVVEDVADHDAVIVGSALNMRTWLRPPVRFLRRNEEILKGRPVWLFSSGLLVKDPRSVSPKVISKFDRTIGPRGHRFFAGSLDPKKMEAVHRMALRLPGVRKMFPIGDFRDWAGIQDWTIGIAHELGSSTSQSENKVPKEISTNEPAHHLCRSQTMME